MTRLLDWRAARGQFGLILAHAVLMQIVTGIARPTISYRALDLSVPPSLLGLVAATYTAVPLLFAVLAGRVVDRRGERPALVAGTAMLVVSSLVLLSREGGVAVVLLASAVLGLGQLLSMLGQQARVAGLSGPSGYDAAFGYFVVATSVGQIVGPAIVSLMAGSTAMPETGPLFGASTVAAVMMMAVALVLLSSPRTAEADQERGRSVRRVLTVPGLAVAIVSSLVVIASVDLLTVYLPLLGTERAIAASTIGVLLVVRAASSLVSRLFLGPLVSRFARPQLLTWSIGLAALSTGVLAISMPIPSMIAVMALVGLGLGLGQPLTMAWVAEAAPSGLRATALSLRLAGNRLGQTLIPAGVGFVVAGSGAAGVFLSIGAGLGATSALVVAQSVSPAHDDVEGDAGGRPD